MSSNGSKKTDKHPNILLITVDQMQTPETADESADGIIPEIAKIVRFAPTEELKDNPYCKYFPGLMALRRNAVVMRNHSIASSACVPSRSAIYTGQYASRTGVTQTDGIFKDPNDSLYPWLAPNGAPTMGDWFRAAGYETHYFGKWHVSNPTVGSLEPWGFSNWELSIPEAQGLGPGNLGVYRDISFTDLINTFLDRKALGSQYEVLRSGSNMAYPNNPVLRKHFVDQDPKPWLAVASLVNPHDITGWPRPWQPGAYGTNPTSIEAEHTPPAFPVPNSKSNAPTGGTKQVPLNPDGIPEELFNFTADIGAELDHLLKTKPRAQYDSAYKVGLGFKSQWPNQSPFGYNIRDACPMPFQLLPPVASQDAESWYKRFGNYYVYYYYLVDLQIRRIMDCLDSSGLRDSTILVFLSDHGEYAGTHGGMIEKWYTAYQEILHVPCLVASPLVNANDEPRYVDSLTSHIDILPTVLGLAGYDSKEQERLSGSILGKKVFPLPGVNLSDRITDPNSQPAAGAGSTESILFVTDDDITAPLSDEYGDYTFQYYLKNVEALREQIELKEKNPEQVSSDVAHEYPPKVLFPGTVVQPNHLQCVRSQEWKLVRYWDPSGKVEDEWEFYNLASDPREHWNLVTWENGKPVLNEKGVAQPGAREMLVSLRVLLNKKLRNAGYPEVYLHPDPEAERSASGAS